MRSAVNSFYKTPLPPFTKAAKKNVKRGGGYPIIEYVQRGFLRE
jgi:hypothetical protein